MPQQIFLVGPTCVGKSIVAIELAKNINAEIVSCDSMQVYRGMDIGTAKPTKENQEIIPHHMIDIIDLSREYNVAQYIRDASKIIDDIKRRNKVPLIVGGTGLYVKALIDGIFVGPSGDKEIRTKLEERVKIEGLNSLYSELIKVDPTNANRIKPKDKRRIFRALEVYYITGKPISSFQMQWGRKTDKPLTPPSPTHDSGYPCQTWVGCPGHPCLSMGRGEGKGEGSLSPSDVPIIGLNRDRKDLYSRIDIRVEKMFQDGFVNEVRGLRKQGLVQNKTASQALGYKEILGFLDGKYTLDQAKELIKRNTRHFAKRQLTWFKKDDRVKWILIQKDEDISTTVKKVEELL